MSAALLVLMLAVDVCCVAFAIGITIYDYAYDKGYEDRRAFEKELREEAT